MQITKEILDERKAFILVTPMPDDREQADYN